MAHHIYHTHGFILGSVSTGESNRFYKIFTEELGLVGASAQSVRVEKSKLRYVLQDFSWVTVDLIRGKEVWRVISAGEKKNFSVIKANYPQLKLFARVCSLVARLVHGEGKEDVLFNDLCAVAQFLNKELVPTRLEASFEALAALRALSYLGYFNHVSCEEFLFSGDWSLQLLEKFEKTRVQIVPSINAALIESQL